MNVIEPVLNLSRDIGNSSPLGTSGLQYNSVGDYWILLNGVVLDSQFWDQTVTYNLDDRVVYCHGTDGYPDRIFRTRYVKAYRCIVASTAAVSDSGDYPINNTTEWVEEGEALALDIGVLDLETFGSGTRTYTELPDGITITQPTAYLAPSYSDRNNTLVIGEHVRDTDAVNGTDNYAIYAAKVNIWDEGATLWTTTNNIAVGDVASSANVWYTCIAPYTTGDGTTPDALPSNFEQLSTYPNGSPAITYTQDPTLFAILWEFVGYDNVYNSASGLLGRRTVGANTNTLSDNGYRDWRKVYSTSGSLPYKSQGRRYTRQGIIDSLYIKGVVGVEEIHILVFSKTDGAVVYDNTIQADTVYYEDVADWYEYFFSPPNEEDLSQTGGQDFYVADIPHGTDYYLSVEFKHSSTSVGSNQPQRGVQQIVAGRNVDLGISSYGTDPNMTDYSIKDTNDFGEFTIVERKFSAKNEYEFVIPLRETPYVQKFLSRNRVIPMVYIGHPEFSNTITFGFFKRFSIPLSDYVYSYASIEVEGL